MPPYYSPENLNQLRDDQVRVRELCVTLRRRCVLHAFVNERAREHALHGLSRRVGMMSRALDLVFEVLPPDLDVVPEQDKVEKATIALHSFVINCYGSLDNIAWIWVHERGIRRKNGRELRRNDVGLGDRYELVRESFPSAFRDYLDSRQGWFQQVTDLRDSLAHRIPLYIPPHMVSTANHAKYSRLDDQWAEALGRGEFDRCDAIRAEQRSLSFFQPVMTSSFYEDRRVIPFHGQIVVDMLTVDEVANKELDTLTS